MGCLRHAFGNTLKHAVTGRLERYTNGVAEGKVVCRAVTLDDDTLQAEQAGTVVASMIGPTLEGIEHRQCGQCRQPAGGA